MIIKIRYQRIWEATGNEVPAEEIVRGFEVQRDNFVVISNDTVHCYFRQSSFDLTKIDGVN